MKQRIIIIKPVVQQVITVNVNVVIFQEDKEQHDKAVRRSQFEKEYSKRQQILNGITVNQELIAFSNQLAQQIKDFKSKKTNQ